MKASAVKCIVKAPRERGVRSHRSLTRGVEREERKRERVRARKQGEMRDFGLGVANEYRVWSCREPIGVRDVLPHLREKRQSGVLAGGVALGERRNEERESRRRKRHEGETGVALRGSTVVRFARSADKDRLPCLPC